MNDIEKAIETLKDMRSYFNDRSHRQYSMPAIDTAISALEKQISIKEVINQLRENKINCKNSSTIYDTKDYVLLDKAIEIVKGDWSVGEWIN